MDQQTPVETEGTAPQKPAAEAGHQPGSPAELGGSVLVRGSGLEKSYRSGLLRRREVTVLEGAEIEIRSGEIVGIVGENGSGKSTLMNILVGVLGADGGTVERHGSVGWCPQEPLLYDRLTVAETFRLFGAGYGMTSEEIEEARARLAEQLGFEQYADFRVDQLSGGNRQKVNLGVALMHGPDVLLLDEPYTGFDWETYLQFWELAEDLAADGTAVAMISHLIEEQDRLDRVYEVREGLVHDVTDHGDEDTEGGDGETRDRDDSESGNEAGDGHWDESPNEAGDGHWDERPTEVADTHRDEEPGTSHDGGR